ncbi:MAG: hypothetical protein KBT36_14175 [Kurthia sp.]|nr:hypothetical protein [Candidatus Kurthia equi]
MNIDTNLIPPTMWQFLAITLLICAIFLLSIGTYKFYKNFGLYEIQLHNELDDTIPQQVISLMAFGKWNAIERTIRKLKLKDHQTNILFVVDRKKSIINLFSSEQV